MSAVVVVVGDGGGLVGVVGDGVIGDVVGGVVVVPGGAVCSPGEEGPSVTAGPSAPEGAPASGMVEGASGSVGVWGEPEDGPPVVDPGSGGLEGDAAVPISGLLIAPGPVWPGMMEGSPEDDGGRIDSGGFESPGGAG
ncbi:MAG TPA: hypothetical protein VM848_12220 [Acidimicrobiia bacterium]|nr:hypothetical protein [Acidimicrobiia bacterium]